MTQTPFKTTKGSFLAVTGLPVGDEDYEIDGYFINNTAIWSSNRHIDLPIGELPPGQWEIIGWSDALSKEQIDKIVESDVFVEPNGVYWDETFRDYNDPKQIVGSEFTLDSMEQSFTSLLQLNNISERALILKSKT